MKRSAAGSTTLRIKNVFPTRRRPYRARRSARPETIISASVSFSARRPTRRGVDLATFGSIAGQIAGDHQDLATFRPKHGQISAAAADVRGAASHGEQDVGGSAAKRSTSTPKRTNLGPPDTQ